MHTKTSKITCTAVDDMIYCIDVIMFSFTPNILQFLKNNMYTNKIIIIINITINISIYKLFI